MKRLINLAALLCCLALPAPAQTGISVQIGVGNGYGYPTYPVYQSYPVYYQPGYVYYQPGYSYPVQQPYYYNTGCYPNGYNPGPGYSYPYGYNQGYSYPSGGYNNGSCAPRPTYHNNSRPYNNGRARPSQAAPVYRAGRVVR